MTIHAHDDANQAHVQRCVAARLRSATREVGVDLTASYARHIAEAGLARSDQLGVTRLEDGVVLHTVPTGPDQSPTVLGFASAAGEWTRDGSGYPPEADL